MVDIKKDITNYIVRESLGDKSKINDDTLIFESGLLDSMGLLFLIEFLKDNYDIEVLDEELNPDNFKSIDSIHIFVKEKLKV